MCPINLVTLFLVSGGCWKHSWVYQDCLWNTLSFLWFFKNESKVFWSWFIKWKWSIYVIILIFFSRSEGKMFQSYWWDPYPVFLILAGVRTEQDLYARLIDSVTKQVGRLSLSPPDKIITNSKNIDIYPVILHETESFLLIFISS